MVRFTAFCVVAFTLVLTASTVPASARPPTVTISPGYDRALADSRRARGAGQPYIAEPAPRYVKPKYYKRYHRR